MSQDKNKKPSKAIVVDELSKAQVEFLDNAINYELQVIDMDNVYNKDRASLVKLIVENIALALGVKPSYALWNSCHNHIKEAICKETGMEFESFDKNIWSNITKRLESDYELTKPSSPNKKSEQKSEQRAKIDAMSDDELRLAGKIVELAKREEKRIKNAEKLEKQDNKDFVKNFKASMDNIAKNELSFAMWIDSNINSIREQFKASQS
jgi:hypothetical protein